MKKIVAETYCPNAKISIAVARFNNFINENLLSGAIDILKRVGNVKNENIEIFWLPGSYELPMIVKELVKTNKYNGIIVLGTIIKGDTFHFEYIAKETYLSLSNITLNSNIPISLGILTTKNIEQAIERSGSKSGNYGAQAAITLLEMINLIKYIRG